MGSATETMRHRELTSLTRKAIDDLKEKCLDLHNLVVRVDAAVQKLDSLTDQMDTTEGEEIENASKECLALTEQMHKAGEIVDIKRATLKSAVKSLTDFYSKIAE
jgi:hypothetical protein